MKQLYMSTGCSNDTQCESTLKSRLQVVLKETLVWGLQEISPEDINDVNIRSKLMGPEDVPKKSLVFDDVLLSYRMVSPGYSRELLRLTHLSVLLIRV